MVRPNATYEQIARFFNFVWRGHSPWWVGGGLVLFADVTGRSGGDTRYTFVRHHSFYDMERIWSMDFRLIRGFSDEVEIYTETVSRGCMQILSFEGDERQFVKDMVLIEMFKEPDEVS